MIEATDKVRLFARSVSDHAQHPAIESRRFPRSTFMAIAVCAVLAAALCGWYLNLRWRTKTLAAQVRRLDERWAIVSSDLEAARNVQTRYEAFLNRAERVVEEGNAKRWTPALRSIAVSGGTGIELRGIRMVESSDHSHTYSLQIEGVSTGSAPRAIADRFLQTLQSELGRQFQVAEPGRFERLEDQAETPAASGDERKATFTITTTIALTEAATAESKGI